MIVRRSIVRLFAGALVATAVYAQSSAAQTPESKAKPAAGAKQAARQPDTIDIKRDAKQAWSEMRRTPEELRKGMNAAGRDARNTFKSGWNKARAGFTGKAPPTIPDPPK